MTEQNPSFDVCDSTAEYCDGESFAVEACGHRFTFYPSGKDRLNALLQHIEDARSTLDVFYYMFQDDEAGTRVRDGLIAALKRGVTVRLVIDDFGSDAPPGFFEPLVNAGGSFAVFSADWNVRYLVRNHQKFAIADNQSVMTGGSNVSDHYYSSPADNGWCDLGVLIEGQITRKFTEWFELINDWATGDGSQFRRIREMIRHWDPGDGDVQLYMGGPFLRRAHWSYRFKMDLKQATQLDLVSAYFGPPRSFRRAIAKVARRGRVRMITAGKSDIEGTIFVARLFYRRLIKAGARIFEFQPCKLHMKLMAIDDFSYFGSANLDRRSIRINIELMVRVKDEKLAERLRKFMDHLQSASVTVDADWYRRESSLLHRAKWRFFHWLSLLDYRAARSATK